MIPKSVSMALSKILVVYVIGKFFQYWHAGK